MNNVHFAIPEIYGETLSYYELLRKIVDKTNELIENYNTVPEQIAEAVANLDASQLFSAVLNQLIHSIATDNTKSSNAVKVYKKHDLLYATFNETVNLYESLIDFSTGTATQLIPGTNIREVNISELFIELRKLIDINKNKIEAVASVANENSRDIATMRNDITDIENKNTEQDNELSTLRTMLSSPYNFKGEVASISALPANGAVNDTYYVKDVKYKVTWTGSAWVQSSLNEADYQTELSELKGDLSNLENNIDKQFNTKFIYEFIWHNGESYDITTGAVNNNPNLKRSEIVIFDDLFNEIKSDNFKFENANDKMLLFVFNNNGEVLSTPSMSTVGEINRNSISVDWYSFGVVEEIAENNVFVKSNYSFYDDYKKLVPSKFLISYFEDEDKSRVHLGLSYDGEKFDKIGAVFSSNETKDPCIVRKGHSYYLVYSHWQKYATNDLSIYKSDDLLNWTLHTTIHIDLSQYDSRYTEIWAPEFFVDNSGTYRLVFSSRIVELDQINEFIADFNDDLTSLSNYVRVSIESLSGNLYDMSFYQDITGIYYVVARSNLNDSFDTYIYTSSRIYGPYNQSYELPAENYNEGMTIFKNGDMWYVYADETVSATESPDHRQLVLYRSIDLQNWSRTICGTNLRHPKIIKADDYDISRAERVYVKKQLIN